MESQKAVPIDVNDGYDPAKAFNQRRQIFLSVQKLQRLEHEVVERIADRTVAAKKELLELLSNWLQKQTLYNSDQHVSVEQFSGCDMSHWINLQSEGIRLQSEFYRSETEATSAEFVYKMAAPLGHVGLGVINQWTAEGEQKNKIIALASEVRSAVVSRDDAMKRLSSNLSERQRFGKKFLRGCLSNIDRVERFRVFGPRERAIMGEMAGVLRNEWHTYIQITSSALHSLDNNLTELRRIYSIDGK